LHHFQTFYFFGALFLNAKTLLAPKMHQKVRQNHALCQPRGFDAVNRRQTEQGRPVFQVLGEGLTVEENLRDVIEGAKIRHKLLPFAAAGVERRESKRAARILPGAMSPALLLDACLLLAHLPFEEDLFAQRRRARKRCGTRRRSARHQHHPRCDSACQPSAIQHFRSPGETSDHDEQQIYRLRLGGLSILQGAQVLVSDYVLRASPAFAFS